MQEALRDSPERQRPVPPGIVSVRIDPDSGQLATSGQRSAIFEYFLKDTVPGRGGQDDGSGSDSRASEELVRDIF
jgi:penicillin-binding protein 1A